MMPAFLFLLDLFSLCVLCIYVWVWMSLQCVFETGSFTELLLSSSGRPATGPWGFARDLHPRAGPTDTHLGLRMDVRYLTQVPTQ